MADDALGWAVAANVTQQGLRHFAPGAKVYVSQVWNGDGGERRWVLGRHRGSHRHVHIIVPQRHLTDARAKAVYSPDLHRRLADSIPRMLFGTREEAETVARWVNPPDPDAPA
jgi:hypothetical protein